MALGFERLSSHGRATKGGLWRTIQSGVVIGAITTLVLLLGLTASGWSGTCLWSGSCAPALAPLPKDSHHVHRFIVPNAQQPAMDYIRSLGISQAVMLDCSPTAAALAKRQLFDDRGISLICLQDEDMTRPLAGSNPTAVVTTSQEGSGIGLSQTLALANLMHGSSRGGSGVRSGLCAVVEFHADNSGAPVRASVLDLQRRDRRVWFASTRVYLDVFNKIYEERTWTDAGGGSGLGSTLEYTGGVGASVVQLRAWVPGGVLDVHGCMCIFVWFSGAWHEPSVCQKQTCYVDICLASLILNPVSSFSTQTPTGMPSP